MSLHTQDSDSAAPTFSALIAGPPGRGRGEPRGGAERQEVTLILDQPRPEAQIARAEPRHAGVAYGLDYVGTFRHHTGTLGPFGFYGVYGSISDQILKSIFLFSANFYDEK